MKPSQVAHELATNGVKTSNGFEYITLANGVNLAIDSDRSAALKNDSIGELNIKDPIIHQALMFNKLIDKLSDQVRDTIKANEIMQKLEIIQGSGSFLNAVKGRIKNDDFSAIMNVNDSGGMGVVAKFSEETNKMLNSESKGYSYHLFPASRLVDKTSKEYLDIQEQEKSLKAYYQSTLPKERAKIKQADSSEIKSLLGKEAVIISQIGNPVFGSSAAAKQSYEEGIQNTKIDTSNTSINTNAAKQLADTVEKLQAMASKLSVTRMLGSKQEPLSFGELLHSFEKHGLDFKQLHETQQITKAIIAQAVVTAASIGINNVPELTKGGATLNQAVLVGSGESRSNLPEALFSHQKADKQTSNFIVDKVLENAYIASKNPDLAKAIEGLPKTNSILATADSLLEGYPSAKAVAQALEIKEEKKAARDMKYNREVSVAVSNIQKESTNPTPKPSI